MRPRPSILLAATVLLIGSGGSLATAGPVQAAVCDGSTASLGNGGFESPPVAAGTYAQLPAAAVPPWQTTDGAGLIEIWGDGFLGFPAAEGQQFAELNATTAGTLYQDVVSTPGATMRWTLLHRGREGDDVMQVLIGDANFANVNTAAGWDYISPNLTDGVTAWGLHGADFVVPAGQTCTRFAFRAVGTGSGSDSVGNLLDAVGFSIPAAPTPRPTVRVTSPPTNALSATDATTEGGSLVGLAIVALAALGGIVATRARNRPTRNRRR